MVRIVIGMMALALATSAANAAPGDAARGAAVFNRCAMCHNADKGGPNGLGPNLFGVVGRKAASLPNFYYSPALKNSKIVWTEAMLRKWVRNPSKLVPGTRMVFPGMTREADVDDLIAFLKSRK
jgi:cytochrome c